MARMVARVRSEPESASEEAAVLQREKFCERNMPDYVSEQVHPF